MFDKTIDRIAESVADLLEDRLDQNNKEKAEVEQIDRLRQAYIHEWKKRPVPSANNLESDVWDTLRWLYASATKEQIIRGVLVFTKEDRKGNNV